MGTDQEDVETGVELYAGRKTLQNEGALGCHQLELVQTSFDCDSSCWVSSLSDPSSMPPFMLTSENSAIILGVLGQSFSTRRWLWHGLWINQDAQLAAFGLINTLLSYGVGDSLSHIAGTTVTRWMVKEDDKGASTLDFDMEDEMREPWTAIANCYTRSENKDWTWKDFLRFVPVFIIGLSMVLLNAAMNTIAIPQDRWWPDLSFSNAVGDERAYFSNKTMRVTNVSRTAVWNQSWDMVREGPGEFSWDVVSHIMPPSERPRF